LLFVNSLLTASFVSWASSAIDTPRLVTGLVTVNGNNKEGRNDFFGRLERTHHFTFRELAFPELNHLTLAFCPSAGRT